MNIGEQLRFHIARNRLGQYCVPMESLQRPCAMTVMRGQVWEPRTLAAIEKHYGGGAIVTAGTYFGDFLPFYGRLAAKHRARVMAFEPNVTNFHCAMVTRSLNNLNNCALTLAALGAERGKLSVKTHDDNGQPLGGGSRVMEARRGSDKARFEDVQVHTIDEHAANVRVGLIQLDTEGHEIAALEGAMATITRDRPLLVLEAHGEMDFDEAPLMQRLARELGYHEIDRLEANRFYAPANA